MTLLCCFNEPKERGLLAQFGQKPEDKLINKDHSLLCELSKWIFFPLRDATSEFPLSSA